MKSNLQPRIVKLAPMRVVSCQAIGKEPEIEAFQAITDWAVKAGLLGKTGGLGLGEIFEAAVQGGKTLRCLQLIEVERGGAVHGDRRPVAGGLRRPGSFPGNRARSYKVPGI